jgi:hypothetical protein
MNKLTITQAAKLAGISRQHLYKKYISTGLLSTLKELDKSFIELSELLRIFPDVSLDTSGDKILDKNLQHLTAENDSFTHILDSKNQVISILEQQLAESKNREEWLKAQLEKTTALIEDKTAKKRKKFLGIF